MARVYDGKVWAVGLWSKKYLFSLEKSEDGVHYFAAVPKKEPFGFRDVNWVVTEDGEFSDFGVGG